MELEPVEKEIKEAIRRNPNCKYELYAYTTIGDNEYTLDNIGEMCNCDYNFLSKKKIAKNGIENQVQKAILIAIWDSKSKYTEKSAILLQAFNKNGELVEELDLEVKEE